MLSKNNENDNNKVNHKLWLSFQFNLLTIKAKDHSLADHWNPKV